MTRSRLSFVLKLLLGLGMLALLLFQGDTLAETFRVLDKLTVGGAILIALLPVVLVWASCLKWQLLLDYRGVSVGLITLMRYYTVGYWFNNFFPSSVGGDAARSYLVGKRIGSQVESFAAVVLERLTGLVTLVLLAVLGYLGTPAIHGDPVVWVSLLIMTSGCAVISLLVWGPARWLPGPNSALGKVGLVSKILTRVQKVRAAMEPFWKHPRVVQLAAGYSFLYHALTVVNVYVTAWALGVEISFIGLCVVTPIILVVAALPTTPGSIGVWEWAYSILLIPVGATLEQGLAIGLVLRAQLLFASLVGGVLYVTDRPAD